jgi:hypothetical protein
VDYIKIPLLKSFKVMKDYKDMDLSTHMQKQKMNGIDSLGRM